MQSTGPSPLAPRFGTSPFSRHQELPGRVDLWLAGTASLHDPVSLRACRGLLSPRELESCCAFRREADQRRALLARGLLRETLSRYVPVPPSAWEFAAGTHGRPEIASPAGSRLRFNLSHTGSLVACALTLNDEIGVDLEDVRRNWDVLELAERVFTPAESADLRGLAPAARQRRFFELWTLKEAYLKARGLGFTLDPRCASFDLEQPGRVRARFAPETERQPADWWFALLDIQPDHVLALASRNGGRPARVRVFRASPGDSPGAWPKASLYAASWSTSTPRLR